jgi:hypothetical protein
LRFILFTINCRTLSASSLHIYGLIPYHHFD